MSGQLRAASCDAAESMTLQIEDADGGLHTITRTKAGLVETSDRPSAPPDTTVVSRFGVDGSFRLLGRDGSGVDLDPPEPIDLSRRTNLYGIEIVRAAYPGGVAVERTFDDEGRLARVEVRGVWGRVAMDLETDGSCSIVWETARVDGEQRWTSARQLAMSDVHVG